LVTVEVEGAGTVELGVAAAWLSVDVLTNVGVPVAAGDTRWGLDTWLG
jgi:hypothetical protein